MTEGKTKRLGSSELRFVVLLSVTTIAMLTDHHAVLLGLIVMQLHLIYEFRR